VTAGHVWRVPTAGRALGRAATLVAAALWALPVVILLLGSLRERGAPPPATFEVVPAGASLDAYAAVVDLLPVATYLRNSLLVVAVAVPVTVVVASLAGLGIRLLRPRLQRLALLAIIVVLLVPASAVWVPRARVFGFLGLGDSLGALMVTSLVATSPFFVIIYWWAFHRIDDEVFDAAAVDGAGPLRTWWAVALPNAGAASMAVGVLAFAAHWGNFMDPLLYVGDPGRATLPLGLSLLQALNPTDFPLLLAGATASAIPPVLLFLLAQRRFLDPQQWTAT